MGMFDHIYCDMPLPKKAADIREWQTKDLGCEMKFYAIRANGALVDAHVRMEKLDGATPRPEGYGKEYLAWYRQWYEHREGPDQPVDFTGEIHFYALDKDRQSIDFVATIDRGKCIRIEPVRIPKHICPSSHKAIGRFL